MLKFVLLNLLLLFVVNLYASDHIFKGYFRSGMGQSKGADQQVFSLQNRTARLGNEGTTYGELTFGKDFKEEDGSSFTAMVTIPFSDNAHTSYDTLTTWLTEAYIEGKNLFAKDMKFWIGKRFYKRHDSHMYDYFYINNSGPGAGVYDIDLGLAKLAVASTRFVDSATPGPVFSTYDFRFSDIPIMEGKFELIYMYGMTSERTANGETELEDMQGHRLSLVYNMPIFGGNSKTVLQYGRGLFGAYYNGTATSDWLANIGTKPVVTKGSPQKDAIKGGVIMELIQDFVIKPMEDLDLQAVFIYKIHDYGKIAGVDTRQDLTEMTIGARPVYHVMNHLDLLFEASFSKFSNGYKSGTTYADQHLQKYTIAPTLVPAKKGYWARPHLRAFYTVAKWNDKAKGAVNAGGPYAVSKSGSSVGVQAEVWW